MGLSFSISLSPRKCFEFILSSPLHQVQLLCLQEIIMTPLVLARMPVHPRSRKHIMGYSRFYLRTNCAKFLYFSSTNSRLFFCSSPRSYILIQIKTTPRLKRNFKKYRRPMRYVFHLNGSSLNLNVVAQKEVDVFLVHTIQKL